MTIMLQHKFKFLFWLALFLCASVHATPQTDHPLEAELWKHRVLIISVPTVDHPMLTNIRSAMQQHENQQAFAERLMVHYEIINGKTWRDGQPLDDQQNLLLLNSLNLKAPYKAAIFLVGLDGGIKLHTENLVSLQNIFQLIDGMPMQRNRQQ